MVLLWSVGEGVLWFDLDGWMVDGTDVTCGQVHAHNGVVTPKSTQRKQKPLKTQTKTAFHLPHLRGHSHEIFCCLSSSHTHTPTHTHRLTHQQSNGTFCCCCNRAWKARAARRRRDAGPAPRRMPSHAHAHACARGEERCGVAAEPGRACVHSAFIGAGSQPLQQALVQPQSLP